MAKIDDSPVADVIRARRHSGSRPGHREPGDRHRLALCVEGGAMRGVVSGAMVAALEGLGLLDVFDVIYGSSAGAMNAAFFVAGQAAFGTTIYYENINNRRFINLARPAVGRPVLNLDFLVWDVMCRDKALDSAQVVRDGRLKIVATNAQTAAADVLGYHDHESL